MDLTRPYDLKKIGERMRRRRAELGYSTKELGLIIGVQAQTISRWETGSFEATLTNYVSIALALGAQPEWLIWGDDAPFVTPGPVMVEIRPKAASPTPQIRRTRSRRTM